MIMAPVLAFAPSKPMSFVSVATATHPKLFANKFDNDNKGLDIVGEESSGPSSGNVMEKAVNDVKVRGQIGAIAVLVVTFSTFVYFKLQYDADPSNFIGSH